MAKEDLAHLISREHVDREIRSGSKTVLIRRCTVKRKLEWKAFTFCEAIFGRLSKQSKAWIFCMWLRSERHVGNNLIKT